MKLIATKVAKSVDFSKNKTFAVLLGILITSKAI